MKNNTKQVRLFVAVDMPDQVKQEVARIRQILQEQDVFEGRFVGPEQVHITMKFIGEVEPEVITQIDTALQTIEAKKGEAHLGALDVFSKGAHIKIIFLNIVCPELAALAEQVDNMLVPWAKKEDRPFVSHLTLARVKRVADRQKLLQALHTIQVTPLTFTIDSFVLKKSELKPEGPVYTDVARYVLG